MFQKHKPMSVIHLAASVGGIGANQRNPARFWRDNTIMGINVLDGCLNAGVKRLVVIGTTCSYPKVPAVVPFPETELWNGYPEPTNAPYGIAKGSLLVGAMAYRKQFGLDCVGVVPTNLYGPGDNFDEESSHVIPALITKMHWARRRGESAVTLWGTGAASRDFLYVTDAALGVVAALDHGIGGEIYNLGSGSEVTIKYLAEEVAAAVGFKGKILYDSSKPDGQPRRCLDSRKAHSALGWRATVSLATGLDTTYRWWKSRG
jgi:GDP-L-fucose synthase